MPFIAANFDAFGLDIGDRSLKIAHIKNRRGQLELLSYGALEIPAGILEKGLLKNPAALAAAIVKLRQNVHGKKIKTVYVHACLPETQTFIKLLTLTGRPDGQLPALIREELPNHIPLPPDQLFVDWQVVKTEGEKINILVGAVPKTIAESYTAVLAAAGLTAVSLQIEAEAILRSLLPQHELPRTSLAVIDIGASRSSFVAFDQGTIQFSSSLNFAGDALSAVIKNKLNLEWDEAEKAKIMCGLDKNAGEGIVVELVSEAVAELISDIKRDLAYYSEHFKAEKPIGALILCGGGALMRQLPETLRAELPNLNIYLGNPLLNLTKNLKSALARGKSESELNLLRPELNFQKIQTPDILPPAVAITYTTALGLGLSNIKNF